MAQISNDMTFTLIIHTGYDERLTSSGLKSIDFAHHNNRNVEDVFDAFVDEKRDSDDPDYIIAVSATAYYDVPIVGVKETYGTLADTYPSILLDLATVADKYTVDSHICVGNVTLAKSVDLVQAVINPGKYSAEPYSFFACFGMDSMEIKTATSGRRFIIVELATEGDTGSQGIQGIQGDTGSQGIQDIQSG